MEPLLTIGARILEPRRAGGRIFVRAGPSEITREVIRAVYGIDCDIVPVAGRLVVVPHRVATAPAPATPLPQS